jgi:[acyl-carrier-protein] S-malonyltransferase
LKVEKLKETKVTQPAVFYSVILAKTLGDDFKPEMVAGHSLGEFQLWLQMELYHLKMD